MFLFTSTLLFMTFYISLCYKSVLVSAAIMLVVQYRSTNRDTNTLKETLINI